MHIIHCAFDNLHFHCIAQNTQRSKIYIHVKRLAANNGNNKYAQYCCIEKIKFSQIHERSLCPLQILFSFFGSNRGSNIISSV